jgi:hypothetical protein
MLSEIEHGDRTLDESSGVSCAGDEERVKRLLCPASEPFGCGQAECRACDVTGISRVTDSAVDSSRAVEVSASSGWMVSNHEAAGDARRFGDEFKRRIRIGQHYLSEQDGTLLRSAVEAEGFGGEQFHAIQQVPICHSVDSRDCVQGEPESVRGIAQAKKPAHTSQLIPESIIRMAVLQAIGHLSSDCCQNLGCREVVHRQGKLQFCVAESDFDATTSMSMGQSGGERVFALIKLACREENMRQSPEGRNTERDCTTPVRAFQGLASEVESFLKIGAQRRMCTPG